jgi:hypothetical protein
VLLGLADEITHPCGESVDTAAKIVANRLSLFWVIQNFADLLRIESPSLRACRGRNRASVWTVTFSG